MDHHIKTDTQRASNKHLLFHWNENKTKPDSNDLKKKWQYILDMCTLLFVKGLVFGQILCFFRIGLFWPLKYIKSLIFSFRQRWWSEEDGGCARMLGNILSDPGPPGPGFCWFSPGKGRRNTHQICQELTRDWLRLLTHIRLKSAPPD